MAAARNEFMTDIEYEDPLQDSASFSSAVAHGPSSYEFTKFVHVLIQEIKNFYRMQNNVLPITDSEQYNFFLIQLSCCLRELDCPYIGKVIDNMSSDVQSNDGQLLLLDYLMFKLLTARMIFANTPGSSRVDQLGPRRMLSPTVKDLQDILALVETFGLPVNVNPETCLTMLESEIKVAIETERQTKLTRTTLPQALGTDEWNRLEKSFIKIVYKYKSKREEALSNMASTSTASQGEN